LTVAKNKLKILFFVYRHIPPCQSFLFYIVS
jgi:hypothetical protein